MLNVENVATPLTAVTLVVPDSVPPPGFAPSATVIDPVKPVTTFPASSSADTRSAGIVCPACVVCGCVVKATWVAGGGVVVGAVRVAAVNPDALASNGQAGAALLMVHVETDTAPVCAPPTVVPRS